eukprot:CAMPEP_0202439584 /NCGR_PEP_ID=MMETSP1345-20130828/36237_1 /ASSEMBLY_ACC=CAM_ASM_000843 /TAXON_ID=342563 /ORGANISM="Fabrea Fabrea salina" /LENGTH=308 /DNA_ID=CAMNT_0049054119 /DNA_START=939 /DNA_END=1866 /DNA_ORIENTATION=-
MERQKRRDFQLRQEVNQDMKKTNQVLKYILPSFVRKRVKEGVTYIAEDQGDVTVLFCNICHFDEIVHSYSSFELTKLLDLIFTKFDDLCTKVGMTKVETVGYTYMACAGLIDSERDLDKRLQIVSQVRRALEMAVGMASECKEIRVLEGRQLKLKIGIHSGPVAAGVVGSHKPQFSLVGDTVNTASRMASTAENTIQVSGEAYELLDDRSGLHFEQKEIFAKGKGNMVTYDVPVPDQNLDFGLARLSVHEDQFEFQFLEKSKCNEIANKSKAEKRSQKSVFDNRYDYVYEIDINQQELQDFMPKGTCA